MKRTYKLTVISLLLLLTFQVHASGEEKQVHLVVTGETLYSIAEKYGIWVKNLIAHNKYLRDPDKIACDQLLIIPETDKSKQLEEPDVEDKKPQLPPTEPKKSEKNSNHPVQNGNLPSSAGGTQSSLAKIYSEYKDIVFRFAPGESRKVALTFDDGPSEVTSGQVLDILKKYNVKATFFLVGQNISEHSGVVLRMVREGHIVAGHSWSHARLDRIPLHQVQREIDDTEKAIYQATGKKPLLFRPPYGTLNREGLNYLRQKGYKVVNWSVDSLDWKYPDNYNQVIINTLGDVKGGSIMLFHTLPGKEPSRIIRTILPEIIFSLQCQGYEFVTVDELLSIPAYRQ